MRRIAALEPRSVWLGHYGPVTGDVRAQLERGAQAVNGELAGSVLLTRDGYGSLSYFRSACVKLAVDAYVTRTALPPGGTVCESDYPA